MQESIFFSFFSVLIAIFFRRVRCILDCREISTSDAGLEFVSPECFFCFLFFQVKRNTCCGFFARFFFLYVTPNWTSTYTAKCLRNYLSKRKKLAGQIYTINTALLQSVNHVLRISHGAFHAGFVFLKNNVMSKIRVEKNIDSLHCTCRKTTAWIKLNKKANADSSAGF